MVQESPPVHDSTAVHEPPVDAPAPARKLQLAGAEQGPSHSRVHPDANERQATEESRQEPIARPGGFKNDPPDPTNPNEVIERCRRTLRP